MTTKRKSRVFLRAADIFVERAVPHVCWAVAIADGYSPRDYLQSPAVRWFQEMFAAPGAEILQTGDMLNAVEGDEQGLREFSLLLLAMASCAVRSEDP